jgi:hypothetical protein
MGQTLRVSAWQSARPDAPMYAPQMLRDAEEPAAPRASLGQVGALAVQQRAQVGRLTNSVLQRLRHGACVVTARWWHPDASKSPETHPNSAMQAARAARVLLRRSLHTSAPAGAPRARAQTRCRLTTCARLAQATGTRPSVRSSCWRPSRPLPTCTLTRRHARARPLAAAPTQGPGCCSCTASLCGLSCIVRALLHRHARRGLSNGAQASGKGKASLALLSGGGLSVYESPTLRVLAASCSRARVQGGARHADLQTRPLMRARVRT